MCPTEPVARREGSVPSHMPSKELDQRGLVSVRPAVLADVPAIAELVGGFAQRGLILPRSEAAIRGNLTSWIVAAAPSRIVGCGSLVPYADDLAEVRSLAVAPSAQRQGLGTAMVHALIELGQELGFNRLFALTRRVPFFERLGFVPAEVAWFPEKVWRDCAMCPLIDRCDEHAVVLDLDRRSNAEGAYR